ncbi:hypothetical protein HanHA300_Chr03g0096741 [Helianthus annuus]|nr:hypothetical protein HanHA300_Chr03g0096741 [Helianthus annuus]KAJ0601289.1 hypothetical protein HanIR_Chr03g0126661 [Helianthus annuus]KAJ0608428.1 hypothetical protein HanHA89_Chr03g0108431 [Helianthus annuus]KAJ0768491.1 hypothetical protein HanLR1_Chr03g0101791 [Helianthus annuus]
MNPSLQNLFHFFFIFFFTLFTSKAFSSSIQPISYSDHCNSYAPEAIPTDTMFTRFPVFDTVTTHYTGGQNILDQHPLPQRSILFEATHNLYKTNVVDTYKIQAQLSFFPTAIYYRPDNFSNIMSNYSRVGWKYRRPLVFYLDGFWSASTSKLCMVGSARWFTKEGNPLTLNAVLKLKFARFINMNNSLVSGILESLASPNDFDHFDPISILAFPRVDPLKYKYTLESNKECNVAKTKTVQDSVASMKSLDICLIFRQRFTTYKLEYPSNCKNCSLFGQDHGNLPGFMSLYTIQCSDEDYKLRFLIEFQDRRFTPYDQAFQPEISLIGEGTWNGRKDELCITACHILNQSDPLGDARVGDCSIGLTLWFPAARSITKTHNTEGQIWTTKLTNDQGSFRMAKFQSFDHSRKSYGAKYEYTQMEKVRRICPKQKRVRDKYLMDEYQSGYYSFGLSVKHKDMVLRGFAAPIFMGSRGFNDYEIMNPNFSPWQEELTPAGNLTTTYSGSVNVTFEISFTLNTNSISRSGISSLNLSSSDNHKVEISAEGVYYDETGQVCMVGCRNLKNSSFDCEILVKFQFPRSRESLIKGNIESLREKNDPLYFEKLDIVSRSFSPNEAREWLQRMDLETVMVLISNTLMCVFTGRQLFHLKKRAETVNSISLLMMLVLTLGHMVPLVLNFEAIFSNTRNQQNVPVRINGLLEVNEVIVRIVTMVAFILQFRLLQLTWIAKKNHWIHEIRTLVVCLPMYIIGGSVMLLVNWKSGDDDDILSQLSIWGDLRSYAGLTIDGFLFPQLILNIFQISKGNALSHWFYIGTTFVRLMPHAYDLYRGQMYTMSHAFDGLYVYANPRSDFYSPLWDNVIVWGGLVFAVIVFLQQLFGGRFMLPKRFQEHVEYEMVPVSNPDEPNKDAARLTDDDDTKA